MTVFYCRRCSTPLTGELVALPGVPEFDADDVDRNRDRETGLAPSTVPRGHFAVDPEPWGAPFVPGEPPVRRRTSGRELLRPATPEPTISAGSRDTFVVHRDDVPSLQLFDDGPSLLGCCRPTGANGPNLACPCGSRLGTWAADCIGPNELHLDPLRVFASGEQEQAHTDGSDP